jgi:hypothetical protein
MSRDLTDVGELGPLTGRRNLMFQQLTAVELLGGSVLQPNLKYRTAIGVLGAALPPVLVAWQAVEGFQNSISAYYYTGGRDWFVGTLWVVGVFLFFYQYKPKQPGQAKSQLPHIQSGLADGYLGKFAGVSALEPMHRQESNRGRITLARWTFAFSWLVKGKAPAVKEAPTAHRTGTPAGV